MSGFWPAPLMGGRPICIETQAMVTSNMVKMAFVFACFKTSVGRASRSVNMGASELGPNGVPSPRPRTPHRMTTLSSKTQDLLPRIAAGEATAVNDCLQRYSPLVWSMARKFWRDIATVEDIVQEIFIDVWKSAGRFDSNKASETTFISTIARRRMIDRQRRQGSAMRTEPVDDLQIGVEDLGLAAIDVIDEASVVHKALETLKPDQRRVILMSVVEGLTHPEIAAATGIPLGTVKSHIRRGLNDAAQLIRAQEKDAEKDPKGGGRYDQ
ncbi:MAG: RNA polymerase sigma factor (sigma-70 family) [Planctomycetota bacterium]|jgi:RNA polymerase sigma factor (sigma-70 family)